MHNPSNDKGTEIEMDECIKHDPVEIDRDEDSVHWRCDECGAEDWDAVEDWGA